MIGELLHSQDLVWLSKYEHIFLTFLGLTEFHYVKYMGDISGGVG